MKLVECVPNFSEGRNKDIIKAITNEIEKISGVKLLDVDPGAATNRTVVTFVGSPDAAVNAAFAAIKKAHELIDMSKHKGEHPRQGACDVCPFIPVSDVTMEECVELASRLGEQVGRELKIPVYLYECAATSPQRKCLSDIREGEYECLEEKLKKPQWKPDFGPAKFDKKFGAIVIGARNFLIAYNVNLNTKNVKLAKEIAHVIRDKGRVKKDEKGSSLKDKNGEFIKIPGLLKECKATGWYIEEYGCAQVTMNLTNFNITPVHVAFDAVCEQAQKLGARVTGSEIVGLVPKDALLAAGKHYLKKQGETPAVSEKELINMAIKSLGLNELSKFDPQKKIIENFFEEKGKLCSMTIYDFADELASSSPAPGGGSVAALCGTLSSSLSAMVSSLTFAKKGYENVKDKMEELGAELQKLKDIQLKKVDEDTLAFNKVMEAFALPKKTDGEKAVRAKAIMEANKSATLVPLSVVELSLSSAKLAKEMILHGNQNSLSDAAVALICAHTSAYGAYFNVLINLKGITDSKWCDEIKNTAKKFITDVDKITEEMKGEILKRLA